MTDGFFPSSTLHSRPPDPLVPRCGACGLLKCCKSPKMPVHGQGRRKVLVVGEAPGETEDSQNRPFIGRAGQHLREALDAFDVDLDRDCWTTNALICHPADNRTPTPEEIVYCRPNVINAIKQYNPTTILLLGGAAIESVIGWLWKSDVGAVSRWTGWKIPSQKLNAWVCPTWHPSYLLRNEKDKALALWWKRHLQAVFTLKEHPWKKVPNYALQTRVVWDTEEAAGIIRSILGRKTPVVIDYETVGGTKPEFPNRRIVCCGVSDGETSIAYPWQGEAIQATKELWVSAVPKIASNLAYEHRWTLAQLGMTPRNWQHDTMVCAHVLDNRDGVCGLKFQAFVRLGQPSYDDALKPHMGNAAELDLGQLMRYCATDALLEWHVAKHQQAELEDRCRGIR